MDGIFADPFDPRTWPAPEPTARIWLDDYGNDFALVDAIDYPFLVQWRWHMKPSRNRKHVYVYRKVNLEYQGRGYTRPSYSLYMHVAIMRNAGIEPPTPDHKVVDHRNGRPLDCRRHNLRWATFKQNAMNIHGRFQNDFPC